MMYILYCYASFNAVQLHVELYVLSLNAPAVCDSVAVRQTNMYRRGARGRKKNQFSKDKIILLMF